MKTPKMTEGKAVPKRRGRPPMNKDLSVEVKKPSGQVAVKSKPTGSMLISPESAYQGQALINMIELKRLEKNLGVEELAVEMDMAITTIQSILKKRRDLSLLPLEVMKKIANWLDIPALQVGMLCGAIVPEDFFVARTLDQKLDAVYERIKNDIKWAGYLPSPEVLNTQDRGLKVMLALMYNELTSQEEGEEFKAELEIKRFADEGQGDQEYLEDGGMPRLRSIGK